MEYHSARLRQRTRAYRRSNRTLSYTITLTWIFCISLILIFSSDDTKTVDERIVKGESSNTTQVITKNGMIHDMIRCIAAKIISKTKEVKRNENYAKTKFSEDVSSLLGQSIKGMFLFIKCLAILMQKIAENLIYNAITFIKCFTEFLIKSLATTFYWTKRIYSYLTECTRLFIESNRGTISQIQEMIKHEASKVIQMIQNNFMLPYYATKAAIASLNRFFLKMCFQSLDYISKKMKVTI